MKISLNNYLNVFHNTVECKNGYDIGDLRVIEVDKSQLLKLIVESDVNEDRILLGVELGIDESYFGQISKSKMTTAINLLKKKAKDGTRIDDFVSFNRIQRDINNLTMDMRHREWKKKEKD